MLRLLALAAALLAAASDMRPAPQTVLTRDGKKLVGEVERDGETVVVRTAGGAERVPAAKVLIVFADPREGVARAQERLEQAKKIYEEARRLPDRDPLRTERLEIAIDILGDARDLYEVLGRHYQTEEFKHLPAESARVMQLMRLCRDAKGSTLAGGGALTKPSETPLATGDYRPAPPAPRSRPWIHDGDLGTGQLEFLKGIDADDPKVRVEALKKLTSPVAPHAAGAVAARLERETHPEVIKAIGEFFDRHGVVLTPKQLAWARKDSDPYRRVFAIAMLKRGGDKAACEALAEWLVESPPLENLSRAAMCSAFRAMREHAVAELKEALSKTRDRGTQIEVIKQIGMLRDRRLGSVLLQAMPSYPSHTIVAFLRWGKEAVPDCSRGMRGGAQDVKRWCTFVCRRVTNLDNYNPGPFEDWYVNQKKQIADDEAKWWREQAEKDFPVDPNDFRGFDRKLEEILQ